MRNLLGDMTIWVYISSLCRVKWGSSWFWQRSLLCTIYHYQQGVNQLSFPYIPDMRDEFRSEPVDTDAILNEDVVLECNPPKGHPEPVVKWKKDGDNLDLTSSKRIKIDERGNLVRYHFSNKGRKINFWCIVQFLKFWKLLRNCNLFCKSILCQYFTLVCCKWSISNISLFNFVGHLQGPKERPRPLPVFSF